MANESMDFEDNENAGESERKSKGIGGLLPTLLKWVAIILGAFCPIISITHGTILSTLYILFNLPAIIIQRFNRPRYKSALLKITQRGI